MEGKDPSLEAVPPTLGGPGAAALEGCGHAFLIAAYFFHFEYHLFRCHGNVKSLF